MNLGRLVVLKARMSQERHAAEAYKSGGGNLFVVFGEPDIALDRAQDGTCTLHLRGVDIFDPTTGEVRCSGKVEDDVACWFVDTDYDGDSFFVRQAYFLGGKDPYEKLKSALKAEIDPDACAGLYSTTSRKFPPPKSGRIAVEIRSHRREGHQPLRRRSPARLPPGPTPAPAASRGRARARTAAPRVRRQVPAPSAAPLQTQRESEPAADGRPHRDGMKWSCSGPAKAASRWYFGDAHP